jgi:hypothetical protein
MRRRLLTLWMLLSILLSVAGARAADAAGCGSGHVYDGSGARLQASCFVVESSVHGYACPTLYQDDGMGMGAASAQQAAEHTARIACVEAYEASQGVLHSGNFGSDGNDRAYDVGLDEVKILSAGRH